ncbi:MAG: YqaE/Pmp3 family membrane protein [Bacteroidota bacterium]|nr:YqaE/Pmp3 family membrane protein [Bacteroidota bacterium]
MNHSDGDVSAVLLVILCILLPPLAVFLVDGIGLNFWLDLILTLLFFLPGIIFALIVCFA